MFLRVLSEDLLPGPPTFYAIEKTDQIRRKRAYNDLIGNKSGTTLKVRMPQHGNTASPPIQLGSIALAFSQTKQTPWLTLVTGEVFVYHCNFIMRP